MVPDDRLHEMVSLRMVPEKMVPVVWRGTHPWLLEWQQYDLRAAAGATRLSAEPRARARVARSTHTSTQRQPPPWTSLTSTSIGSAAVDIVEKNSRVAVRDYAAALDDPIAGKVATCPTAFCFSSGNGASTTKDANLSSSSALRDESLPRYSR